MNTPNPVVYDYEPCSFWPVHGQSFESLLILCAHAHCAEFSLGEHPLFPDVCVNNYLVFFKGTQKSANGFTIWRDSQ